MFSCAREETAERILPMLAVNLRDLFVIRMTGSDRGGGGVRGGLSEGFGSRHITPYTL